MTQLVDALAAGQSIDDRVVLVAAHPDDETLSLGTRLSLIRRLTIIHLTDGAPRDLHDAERAGYADWQSYAAARRAELADAFVALGCTAELITYDFPDQESVFHLPEIVERLTGVLCGASLVITHPYEHGHPDHDSAAVAVQLSCAALRRRDGVAPARWEFASYHRQDGDTVIGRFFHDETHPEVPLIPSAEAIERKAVARDCFRTQSAIIHGFPLAPEYLRLAPDYDFSRPARPGEAVYDSFGWPLTAERWRRTVATFLTA